MLIGTAAGSLGVKLDYTDSSKGAVVREVGPAGKIPSWNVENKANAVPWVKPRSGLRCEILLLLWLLMAVLLVVSSLCIYRPLPLHLWFQII